MRSNVHARRGGATRNKNRVRSLYYRNSATGESSPERAVKKRDGARDRNQTENR